MFEPDEKQPLDKMHTPPDLPTAHQVEEVRQQAEAHGQALQDHSRPGHPPQPSTSHAGTHGHEAPAGFDWQRLMILIGLCIGLALLWLTIINIVSFAGRLTSLI